MTNSWIEHCKQYAKDNNVSYSVAMLNAGATYTKKEPTKKVQKEDDIEGILEDITEEIPKIKLKKLTKKERAKKKQLLEAIALIESESSSDTDENPPMKVKRPRKKKQVVEIA